MDLSDASLGFALLLTLFVAIPIAIAVVLFWRRGSGAVALVVSARGAAER